MAVDGAPEARGFLSRIAGAAMLLLLPAGASGAGLEPYTGPVPPPLALDALNGRAPAAAPEAVTLVHFFATWCPPCVAEFAALERLAARRDPAGLRIVAVNVAEVDATVRRFVAARNVAFPVLMDRDRAAARAWGVSVLPASFLVAPGGRPLLAAVGEVDWDAPGIDPVLDALAGPASGLQLDNDEGEDLQ